MGAMWPCAKAVELRKPATRRAKVVLRINVFINRVRETKFNPRANKNPNPECLNPKEARNPKTENQNGRQKSQEAQKQRDFCAFCAFSRLTRCLFCVSEFVIRLLRLRGLDTHAAGLVGVEEEACAVGAFLHQRAADGAGSAGGRITAAAGEQARGTLSAQRHPVSARYFLIRLIA